MYRYIICDENSTNKYINNLKSLANKIADQGIRIVENQLNLSIFTGGSRLKIDTSEVDYASASLYLDIKKSIELEYFNDKSIKFQNLYYIEENSTKWEFFVAINRFDEYIIIDFCRFPIEPSVPEVKKHLEKKSTYDEIYKIIIDKLVNLLKKNASKITQNKTSKPNKQKSNSHISEEELESAAENCWVRVTDMDFRHDLSQEELISEVIIMLEDEDHFNQELTSSQEKKVTQFLEGFGEFIYEAPNREHYDTDQGWL